MAAKRAIIAKCTTCLRPFPAGWAGGQEMALGVGGGSMYVGELNVHGPGVVEMTGVQQSCPYCGGAGEIPDGIYAFLEEGYSLFRDVSAQEARALISALRRYVRDDATEDEVSEAAPERTRPFIQSTLARLDAKYWFGILLTLVLSIVGQTASSEQANRIERDVREAIARTEEHDAVAQNQIAALRDEIERMVAHRGRAPGGTPRAQPPPTTISPPDVLPNRNDPCWCGSGRRFGRCHRGVSAV